MIRGWQAEVSGMYPSITDSGTAWSHQRRRGMTGSGRYTGHFRSAGCADEALVRDNFRDFGADLLGHYRRCGGLAVVGLA
jgi:hypothetical protein